MANELHLNKKRSIIFGLYCSLIGILSLTFSIFFYFSYEHSILLLFLSTIVSSFTISAFLWWKIIEKQKKYEISKGIAVGLASSILAILLSWTLTFLSMLISDSLNLQSHSFFRNYTDALIAIFFYSGATIFYLAFFPLIAGSLIGYYYVKSAILKNSQTITSTEQNP